jgi:hypothetical protein
LAELLAKLLAIFRYTRTTQTSNQVREQLTKITEELGITQKPIVTPELFAQYGVFETELSAYLNEEMVVQALEQLADELNRDMQSLIGNYHYYSSFESI